MGRGWVWIVVICLVLAGIGRSTPARAGDPADSVLVLDAARQAREEARKSNGEFFG